MRKTLILAVALLISTALAAPTFAQSPIPNSDNYKTARATREEGPTVNQLTAVDDARIARLKADLHLTPEQEGSWGNLESALKDISKRRADRVVARWNEERGPRDKSTDDKRAEPPTPIERMRRAAENMNLQAADLKSVADAAEPLFGKLDERQRRILDGSLREQLSQDGRHMRRSAE
jgi:LTXXQ motif family protein